MDVGWSSGSAPALHPRRDGVRSPKQQSNPDTPPGAAHIIIRTRGPLQSQKKGLHNTGGHEGCSETQTETRPEAAGMGSTGRQTPSPRREDEMQGLGGVRGRGGAETSSWERMWYLS